MYVEGHPKIRWLVLIVSAMAFSLRLYHIDAQSLWRDEVDAIFFATGRWSDLLAMFTRPGHNGPLYFLVLRPWITLLGDSEFGSRYLSLVFGVLAVPLVYQLARQLLPAGAGLCGALLLATSPYLVWYSQEAKMYSILVCISALSVWFLLKGIKQGKPHYWVGYVVVTSLGYYTHILAVALLPFHIALFLVSGRQAWTRWKAASIALAALTLPYVPLARWQIPTLLSTFETGHPFYDLSEIIATLFRVLAFGLRVPKPVELVLVIFLILIGTFLYRGVGKRSEAVVLRYPQAAFWLYMGIPIATVYLISLGMPIFTDRYLITIAPGFYLLLACGLAALWTRSRLIFTVSLTGMLLINIGGIRLQSLETIKPDFRDAAAYYDSKASPEDLLVIQMPYVHRNFEYYFRKPYNRGDGPYTNDGTSRREVDRRMREMTDGYTNVWLLQSETQLWDERGLTREWLQNHSTLSDTIEFQGITLSRYGRDLGQP